MSHPVVSCLVTWYCAGALTRHVMLIWSVRDDVSSIRVRLVNFLPYKLKTGTRKHLYTRPLRYIKSCLTAICYIHLVLSVMTPFTRPSMMRESNEDSRIKTVYFSKEHTHAECGATTLQSGASEPHWDSYSKTVVYIITQKQNSKKLGVD